MKRSTYSRWEAFSKGNYLTYCRWMSFGGTLHHFSISGRVGGRRVLRGRVHGPQGGTIACLACLEPDEERGLADKRRSEALRAWRTGSDELENATHPNML